MAEKTREILKKEIISEVVQVKQVVRERPIAYRGNIASTNQAGIFGAAEIGDEAQEVLLPLVLDTRNQINAVHRVFTGSLSCSLAHPREIFRSAILNNGARIMIFHNHPSQDLDPSEADLHFTRRIAEASELLGIELLDHIIVAGKKWLYLREFGMV